MSDSWRGGGGGLERGGSCLRGGQHSESKRARQLAGRQASRRILPGSHRDVTQPPSSARLPPPPRPLPAAADRLSARKGGTRQDGLVVQRERLRQSRGVVSAFVLARPGGAEDATRVWNFRRQPGDRSLPMIAAYASQFSTGCCSNPREGWSLRSSRRPHSPGEPARPVGIGFPGF